MRSKIKVTTTTTTTACHVVTQLHTIDVLVHAADSHPLSIAHICVGMICRSVGEPDYRGSVSEPDYRGYVCEPDCRDLWVNWITGDLWMNRITGDLCVSGFPGFVGEPDYGDL